MAAALAAKTTTSAAFPIFVSKFVNFPELALRAFLLAHSSPTITSRALEAAKKVRSNVLPASCDFLQVFNSCIAPAADVEDAKKVAILLLWRLMYRPTPDNSGVRPNNLSKSGCKTCHPPIETPQNAGNRCSSRDFLKMSRTYNPHNKIVIRVIVIPQPLHAP